MYVGLMNWSKKLGAMVSFKVGAWLSRPLQLLVRY